MKDQHLEKALLAVVLAIVGGALGYAAYLASGGRPLPEVPAGDVVVVSRGERVDLEAQAVAGKYTIYDFYADWCAPCRSLDVRLRELASRHDNVAVRKIDIIDWTTPVVAQHGVEGLPFMILYGPDGKRLAAGEDVYETVSRLFNVDL
ncbi:MAG TPA: thioredoxin family protein [Candidatus Polarisedimenticolia bacterium]